jgi:hypothetical protein
MTAMSAPETPPPASPYGAAPHPFGDAYPPGAQPGVPSPAGPTKPTLRSGLALVSFWAGVATVLVGAVYTLALPVVIRSMSFTSTSYVVLQAGHGILSVVLALVAVVTGLVVLVRRAPGTGFAAAGTALGAAALVSVVLGLLQGVILRTF